MWPACVLHTPSRRRLKLRLCYELSCDLCAKGEAGNIFFWDTPLLTTFSSWLCRIVKAHNTHRKIYPEHTRLLGCVEWLLPQVLQYDVLQYTTITLGFAPFFAVHSLHSMFFFWAAEQRYFWEHLLNIPEKNKKICKIFNTSLERFSNNTYLTSLQWKQISFGRQ